MNSELKLNIENSIAIIGMDGRFPGAKNIDEFWDNLKNGRESITNLTDEELLKAGINQNTIDNSNYVKVGAFLENIDLFDANFFGYNPKEASAIDPQHRIFLECAYSALEAAGYNSEKYAGKIGIFAGVGWNNYLLFNLNPDEDFFQTALGYQTVISNEKDFLTTRISYLLNLKGISLDLQTACSTSLVATSMACQSLLTYQSDMVLAGGINIASLKKTGYLYQEGGILSPDGHCRAFDVEAQGTVPGSGVGVVVLKRLEDALADGDDIQAIIRGSAINNDGAGKIGYTAPSIDGQAEVIAEALALAEVEPETISYIETHGTGTALGDPIEIAALNQVFGDATECAIGSVKTNIGHLDAAAGVTGLIKTVLALKHQQIPPSLHFQQPNPKIDFANSPFYVNTELKEWKTAGYPRRAGVSSFGIGGTNVHVVLEETPAIVRAIRESPLQELLVVSAKTESALETATDNLVEHFRNNPELDLADVAYTLQVGRREFNYRRMVVGKDLVDMAIALQNRDPQRVLTHQTPQHQHSIVFMFPGQGSQYVNMGKELYETEPVFRQWIDRCSDLLEPELGLDLRSLMYPHDGKLNTATDKLKQTAIAQPAIFTIEYALAQLWISWGIKPQATIGHSIGEYVAATIADVFSLEDALGLVAARGKLMQQMSTGSMLAVSLPEAEVKKLLNDELSLAAINAPSLCVVSGNNEGIERLYEQLTAKEIECRHLHTSHAFHSPMMDDAIAPLTQAINQVKLNPPQLPFISNITGTWITTEEATNPDYWAKHARETVRFADGISDLLQDQELILLEVGAGRSLCTLAQKHTNVNGLCSLRHPKEKQSDTAFLLNTLGKLWLYGVQVDWSRFHAGDRRYRLPLPTYPFKGQSYWIEDYKYRQEKNGQSKLLDKKPDITDWFYIPVWRQSLPSAKRSELKSPKSSVLFFTNESSLSSKLAKQLEIHNHNVITVKIDSKFSNLGNNRYSINPSQSSDYDTLFQELYARENLPSKIVHLWSITSNNRVDSEFEWTEKIQVRGFYSLLWIVQAINKLDISSKSEITLVSDNMQAVTGEENLCPEKATLLGGIKVIPQEYSSIQCRSIDLVVPPAGSVREDKLTNLLVKEIICSAADTVIAYRGIHRWVQTYEPIRLDKSPQGTPQLREKGVYLITGGLGGIGLIFAKYLAKTLKPKLVLIGRSVIPAKDNWSEWLIDHDEHNPVSQKIRKIQELETLGAEVLAVSADVSNLEQMQAVIVRSESLFGQINGVIHAAGITEEKSFSFIEQTKKIDCELQFQPKVYGLLVLENILINKKIDFCLLMSSLSSVLGGLGFFTYAAVNSFMDAFVHRHNQINDLAWTSVNWDAWHTAKASQQNQSYFATGLADLAIKPDEGVKALQRILNYSHINRIVVSTGELQTRIERWIDLASCEKKVDEQKTITALHPRANLQNPYIAPQNEIEEKIAVIWQELIGTKQVGIYDNFFELGGDSLLMVQVRSRLQEIFNCNISTAELFEYPTIGSLSKSKYFQQQNNEPGRFDGARERAKKREAAIVEEIESIQQRRKVR
jgi:acyl transferase domain-containing protein/acyl carrier protein